MSTFNVWQFALIVAILAAIELASYLAIKFLGHRAGSILTGFLGGFVSSTAVTLTMARRSRHLQRSRLSLSSVMAAKIAALIEVFTLVYWAAPVLALALIGPLVAALIVGLVAMVSWGHDDGRGERLPVPSPLDVKGVLRLAVLLVVILTIVAYVQKIFGSAGTLTVSFLTGLFELHGLSVATSTLLTQADVTLPVAYWSLIFATVASLCAKIGLAWMVGSRQFARRWTAAAGAMLILLMAVAWIMAPNSMAAHF